jgi:transcriptional regulator GlxA family with amidase domain
MTDMSVAAWVLGERLALAQRYLEQIAARAGFGSTASLRQRFRAAFRVSPREWRRTFRG